MTLHLCSIKLVSEQSYPRPLLPCLSSRLLFSQHRDADCQKSGLQEMLFISRRLISTLFLYSLGYYSAYLLCPALITVSGCSRLKTGLQQIPGNETEVLNTKPFAYMIPLATDFLPCLYCHHQVDWEYWGISRKLDGTTQAFQPNPHLPDVILSME